MRERVRERMDEYLWIGVQTRRIAAESNQKGENELKRNEITYTHRNPLAIIRSSPKMRN